MKVTKQDGVDHRLSFTSNFCGYPFLESTTSPSPGETKFEGSYETRRKEETTTTTRSYGLLKSKEERRT